MIWQMKEHIVSYNLDQFFFSKSKIHTLPNYEQMNLKTAIVVPERISGGTFKSKRMFRYSFQSVTVRGIFLNEEEE